MFKLYIILLCALSAAAWVSPLHDKADEGSKAYYDQKYPEAVQKYSEAEEYAAGEYAEKITFNKGAAEYMAGNYDKAAALFGEAAMSENEDVQKKSFFNMGCAYLKMNKKKEAFEAYKNALEIDPAYMNAKKNIEYLLKKQDDENQRNKDDGSGKREQNGEDKQDKSGNGNNQEQMNAEQLKNLLESMKNKPIQRSKGGGKRYLEKDW